MNIYVDNLYVDHIFLNYGTIQVLRNALGEAVGGGSDLAEKSHYGVRFNVISITKGWVDIKFPGKKHYVTL